MALHFLKLNYIHLDAVYSFTISTESNKLVPQSITEAIVLDWDMDDPCDGKPFNMRYVAIDSGWVIRTTRNMLFQDELFPQRIHSIASDYQRYISTKQGIAFDHASPTSATPKYPQSEICHLPPDINLHQFFEQEQNRPTNSNRPSLRLNSP